MLQPPKEYLFCGIYVVKEELNLPKGQRKDTPNIH